MRDIKISSEIESFQYLKRLFPPDFVGSLSEEDPLYKVLVGQRPALDVWRQHINDCLELAYRYNLVDADLEARLKKGDWDFWQANINELKVAKFLEAVLGLDSLRWHPQGQKGRVGEFNVILGNSESVFVEVKTIFPRELEALEQRIKEKLMRYAEEVPIPVFLNVHIREVGESENFSGRKFKAFLSAELTRINVEPVKEEPLKLPDYKDAKTGLHLEVGVMPIPPDELTSCHIGVIGGEAKIMQNWAYIRHSLSKAYSQLPVGHNLNLVVLCSSTAFPINEWEISNALLGTLAYRVYYQTVDRTVRVPEPESFRKPDGFFQPNRNRKLSAVGLYNEKLTETEVETNLEIYHNPCTLNPLANSIFSGKGIRELVKKNDREMEWIG